MPNAIPDVSVTVAPDKPASITLPAVQAGGVLTGFSQPASGQVSLNPDQSLTYTPPVGFLGQDEFTYTVLTASGSAQGRVVVTVARANKAPVAAPDTASTAASTQVSIPVLANDNDPDGDPLQIVAIASPAHGTVSLQANQQIAYVPQTGFAGIDSFSYTISDGHGGFATGQVSVTVTAQDGTPVAVDDAATTLMNTPVTVSVLANDSDPDGNPLVLTGVGLPRFGALSTNPDQTITYTPATGYVGTDQFAYQISDGEGGVAQAQVTVQVMRADHSPVAQDDAATTPANTPVKVPVLANDSDPDGDPLTLVALGLPDQGSLSVNPDQTITYTPAAGFVGQDEFTYTVSDGWGGSDTATVTVTVGNQGSTTFPNGYGCRRRLVIPADLIQGQHAGFPFWVSLSGAWLKPQSAGGKLAGGSFLDVRFELEDGTKLAHEVEAYDPAAGQLSAWVRLPTLSEDADTRLFIYYGNPALAADESNAATLWADYLAVWHLPKAGDATPGHHDLTKAGTVADDPAGGLAGDSRFAGTGVLQLADASWMNGLGALTVQLRAKADATGNTKGLLNGGAFTDSASALTLRYGGSDGSLYAKLKTSAGAMTLATKPGQQAKAWQALALAWAAGDRQPALYLDGTAAPVASATQIASSTTALTAITGPLVVGAGSADSAAGGWQGLVDEVRVRAGKLVDDWLAAEHANQNAPDTFFGCGDEDTPNGPQASPVAVPVAVATLVNNFVDVDVMGSAVVAPGTTEPVLTGVSQPDHGIASVIGGKVRYTPTVGFAGRDSFTYGVAAGHKGSTGRITVAVNRLAEDVPEAKRTVPVASAADLTQALADAQPGDHIVLADGAYAGGFVATCPGTATDPIVIRAANPLGASIRGSVALNAAYSWLHGVALPGTDVQIAADGVRVARCKQTDTISPAVLVTAGHGVEIDHNEISGCHDRGVCLQADPANPAGLRGVHVHHNYLHDFNADQALSLHTGIEIGTTVEQAEVSVQAVVEWNLLQRVGTGSDCVAVRSSDNLVQLNTLLACPGHLASRQGERNQLVANWLEASLGVRLSDRNGTAVGNVLIGCQDGLELMAGNAAPGGAYPACENWLLAGNKANATTVGAQLDADCLLPAANTRIEAHTGPVKLGLQAATTQQAETAATVPPARRLGPADVGPAIP